MLGTGVEKITLLIIILKMLRCPNFHSQSNLILVLIFGFNDSINSKSIISFTLSM